MNPNCESFPSGNSKSQPWKKDWPPTLKASTIEHGVQGGGNIGEKIYNLGSGLDVGPHRGKLYDVGSEPEKSLLSNSSESQKEPAK